MDSTPAMLLLISALFLSAALPYDCASVLDTAGKPLQPGVDYYILPVIRGRGGGLTLAGRNRMCPLNVAQESSEVSNGLPLKFFPADSNARTVDLLADVNVVFSAATICVQSTSWKVGRVDGGTRKRYVVSGGVVGNPGPSTVSNWFRIERSGKRDYKIVFCPGVCSFCRVACGDVGLFFEGRGKRWLGLGGAPLPVMFKKAARDFSPSTVTSGF